jgi:signal transduction histidine kinase/ActR/RegA family two-component response regulator
LVFDAGETTMDFRINNTVIPDHVVERWQKFVDTVSVLASAPSAMINRLDPPYLEVFRSNVGPENPFPTGTRMPLAGIYCESAARRRQRVQVVDARTDREWADSPTAKAGICAYLGYPLLWPDGSVFGTLCIVDTKEHRWGEEIDSLLGSFKDAIETHLALAYANEVVKAADQAKSEFLANVSHEIRTPMTSILGFSDVLLESNLDEAQLDAVATIKRNGQYLIQLVNDILDLSKIEAGKLNVECVECSPCQILCEVTSLMQVRARTKRLTLDVELDTPIPRTIHSDPVRLRQILINLVGNAIKFTETGGVRLRISLVGADSAEPKMQFEVIDTGVGMNESQIAMLFRPFSQVDDSNSRKGAGTGLGLAISKRLAEKLGGDVTVESTPGKGSVFTFTVRTGPIDNVELVRCPAEARLPSNSGAQSIPSLASLDCRILLAEDGPDNQRLISFFLKKAGAGVVIADNGRAACDLALAAQTRGDPFDVILMDMQMPVMDGYDATVELRAAGYSYPIIALTAHAMKADRDRCLKAGCDDYTTKPVDRNRLIALVAQYARQRVPH